MSRISLGVLITFFCLQIFPHQVFAQNFGEGLEQMVLCQENETVQKLAKEIQAGKGVKPEGQNFFQPKKAQQAFGFSVKYIGLNGVKLVPGPNIAVKGNAPEVLTKIKEVTKRSFKPLEYWQEAPVGKHTRILIFPDPKKIKLTYIQCGYFGP